MKIEVKCRKTGATVTTAALVNSGYEVEEPEILLPRRLAEFIGLDLKPPRARTVVYETAVGLYHLVFVPKAVDIHLVEASRRAEAVNVSVSDSEREVLISDMLAGVLGIQLLDIGRGYWRVKEDPPDLVRMSVEPEYW